MITNNNDYNSHKRNGRSLGGNGHADGNARPGQAGVAVEDAPDADEFPSIRDGRRAPERAARQTAAKESDTLPNEDVLSSEIINLELGEGDEEATPDIKRRASVRGSFFKRLLIAFAALALVGAIVVVAGYVVFFRGREKRDLTFQRVSSAQSAQRADDESKKSVTAEEIEREMRQGKATATGSNAESQPGSTGENQSAMQSTAPPEMPQMYSELGANPIAGRPPVDSYSSTVNPSSPAGQVQNQPRSATDSTRESGTTAQTADAPATRASTSGLSSGANPERSIRANSPRTEGDERRRADGQRFNDSSRENNSEGSASRAPARSTETSGRTTSVASVPLPPIGTMLPVRTLAKVYTLRAETLVRMQLTRSIDGPGWSLRRGAEFYGVVRGSDFETGRAYVSLLGFIDKDSNRLVRLSGNLLGGDGAEGLRGNKRRLQSRWSKALRYAGAGALDVFGTLAASLGRRPIIVSDVYGTMNGRAVSPLLQELGRSSNDRRAGFVEVPASTPGYVLVLTMPRSAQGVDAQTDSLDEDALTGGDLHRLSVEAIGVSGTLISDAELSELLTTGTPQQIRQAMPRMTPEMRRVASLVLAQGPQ